MNNNNLKKYSKTINTTHFTQNLFFFGGPQILKMFIYIYVNTKQKFQRVWCSCFGDNNSRKYFKLFSDRDSTEIFFFKKLITHLYVYRNRQYTIQNSSDWSKNNSIFFCKRTNLVFNNLIIINHGERYSNKWLNIG